MGLASILYAVRMIHYKMELFAGIRVYNCCAALYLQWGEWRASVEKWKVAPHA